jgi:hypothetical protein
MTRLDRSSGERSHPGGQPLEQLRGPSWPRGPSQTRGDVPGPDAVAPIGEHQLDRST